MTDLQEAIHRQADSVPTQPDLGDVLQRVSRRRRAARRRGVVAAGALVVVGAITAVVAVRSHDELVPAAPTQESTVGPVKDGATIDVTAPAPAPSATPMVDVSIGGVQLDGVTGGFALERRDSTAIDGPWSVVVRAAGGSLGVDSAVVTYPDEVPGAALRPVAVGDGKGSARDGAVIWPIGDGYARVQGDFPEADLIRIAESVSIVDDRPAVDGLDGLDGFTVEAGLPYRSPVVAEMRYGSLDSGHAAALGGGLLYAGVFSGAAFEDELLLARVQHDDEVETGLVVQGHPAVASAVQGGNGTLAWEPAPGVVAYVGYSGLPMDDAAVAALTALADGSTTLTIDEWSARVGQVVEQSNGPTFAG